MTNKVQLALFLFAMSLSSNSSAFDTYEISSRCESEDISDQIACGFYVVGVLQTVAMFKKVADVETNICFPENINGEIAKKVWLKDVEDHPENLTQPATVTIYLAWLNAYPCAN